MQSILILVGVAFAYGVFSYFSNLRYNISRAKKTGLPYIVAPCAPTFLPSQLTHKIWAPIVRQLLPKAWWEPWLDLLIPDVCFRTRHERFARHGDIFIIVSPKMLYTMVCNAEAISQFASRRESFPKPIEAYAILAQFGDNVLTTEGAVWRMHRKATSASFNEKNAALVFKEAIRQAQGLLNSWTTPTPSRQKNETIHSLDHDTMRLALNIIGYVGFGLSLLWPGETLSEETDPQLAKYGSLEPSAGHKLSFADTIAYCLENILLLLLLPRWLLRLIPAKKTNIAADSGEDFNKYMEELLNEKIDESRSGQRVEGMDLMGQLVRSTYGRRGELRETDGKDSTAKPGTLTRDNILGNAFIMLVAGHETTANAMHFILIELANNPASQRRLQKDIDEMLGDKDSSQWDYETLINPMLASMLGACMNETLRLMPPVVEIPKMVTANRDQSFTMDGQQYVLPKGMLVSLVSVSVHRNPRYWPGRPSRVHPGKDDVNDWVPERWFRKSESSTKTAHSEDTGMDTEDFGGYEGPDTSAQLFRPERGAYIPFSDGPRSCLGRRIAQVEIVAALAVIFRSYSLELAVDQWASDEEVEVMDREKKAELYKTAQDASRSMISRAASVLTLKLHGGDHVPVRLVKRGEERFASWIDE